MSSTNEASERAPTVAFGQLWKYEREAGAALLRELAVDRARIHRGDAEIFSAMVPATA